MTELTITARSNPWVQQWLRYQSKPAERKAAGLAWLEGEHLVAEAFNRKGSHLQSLDALVLPDSDAGRKVLRQLQHQYTLAQDLNIVWLGASVYKSLCTLDSTAIVCAVLRIKLTTSHAFDAPAVVLDGVQDPGNLGTLIRLCAAFAVPEVLLSTGCASAWGSKALRAGQGAQLAIQVFEDVDLAQAYNGFQMLGIPIAATSLASGSIALNKMTMARRMVWVFGSEGQGISTVTQQAATAQVHIPMHGGFESLNVGTAAAICLWQWQQSIS
jgi:RNA methyltransferase, TrmH family